MKRYLIPIVTVVVVLAVAWAAFGQPEEGREGRRPGGGRGSTGPGGGRGRQTDEERARARQEQLKAIEAIEEQVAKLKAGLQAGIGAAGRGGFQDLSDEERTKLRERFTRAREEQQKAIEVIEAQIAKLKDPRQVRAKYEESIGELRAILELAGKEKAEQTAKRLEQLIARRQKEFEGGLQGPEQRRERFQRPRGEEPGRPGEGPMPGFGPEAFRRNLSPEERAKLRERFENMSEEEREKLRAEMRQRFENMSDEEKEELRSRMRERFGGSRSRQRPND